MKRFNNINEFNCEKSTIVTIGTFDGVHLGHQKILKKLNVEAENNGLESSVLTFFPHPRTVLNPDSSLKLINTIEERINLFKKSKIDNLIVHPFTKEFSELDSEDYVKNILVDQLKAKIVLIGYDHKFGKNRTADINNLKEYGTKYNFEVIEIKAEEINDIAISSTKIRNSIKEGDIQLTNSYLGYEFSFFGKVVRGNSIGKTLGFPTANIKIGSNLKLIPKNGVFLITTIINQKLIFGMMNIGIKPTTNENTKSIEVNLFDFNQDLYDKNITIYIKQFLREEIKFDSLNELKLQIEKDKITCNSIINN
ncbi:bifunctional riboflavin kinase/FAD synthetase [Flavobacteriaceae bacterium]|nr:bifunctional riboflavin kinase/FAD synthetase [Flavobacteriaceae bacterium]